MPTVLQLSTALLQPVTLLLQREPPQVSRPDCSTAAAEASGAARPLGLAVWLQWRHLTPHWSTGPQMQPARATLLALQLCSPPSTTPGGHHLTAC